jgi:hypothetical protein
MFNPIAFRMLKRLALAALPLLPLLSTEAA